MGALTADVLGWRDCGAAAGSAGASREESLGVRLARSGATLCFVLMKICDPPELGMPVFAIEMVPTSFETGSISSSGMLPPVRVMVVPSGVVYVLWAAARVQVCRTAVVVREGLSQGQRL